MVGWLVRPSAKQTPDLRRHPSHHLRAKCNALRLEFKLVNRQGGEKKKKGEGREAAPDPKRIHNRVLSKGCRQKASKRWKARVLQRARAPCSECTSPAASKGNLQRVRTIHVKPSVHFQLSGEQGHVTPSKDHHHDPPPCNEQGQLTTSRDHHASHATAISISSPAGHLTTSKEHHTSRAATISNSSPTASKGTLQKVRTTMPAMPPPSRSPALQRARAPYNE